MPKQLHVITVITDLCAEKRLTNKGHGPMGGVFAKYSVQAVAWLFSKKSGLFFGISRFKKIDTVS